MEKALNFMGMAALIWLVARAAHWVIDYTHARSLPLVTEAQMLQQLMADAYFLDIESILTNPLPAEFELPALRIKISIPYDGDAALIHQQGHGYRLASQALLDTLLGLAYAQTCHGRTAQ